MLMFGEEKSPEDEIKACKFWYGRQHSVKQRILDAGFRFSTALPPLPTATVPETPHFLSERRLRHCSEHCLSQEERELREIQEAKQNFKPLQLNKKIFDLLKEVDREKHFTVPKPFSLTEQPSKESDEIIPVFKARPATVLYKKPFQVMKSGKTATKFMDVKLNTEERAHHRHAFDEQRKVNDQEWEFIEAKEPMNINIGDVVGQKFAAIKRLHDNPADYTAQNLLKDAEEKARKVPPPSVPEKAAFRNSGSSFGSAGYASAGEDPDARDGLDTRDGVYGGRSPGAYSCSTFTFPAPQGYVQTIQGKPAVFYQHQCLQEDQGIYMTQSPGRDSPGSSGSGSRHSTVSLDSGRASCHHHRPSLSSSSVGSGESSAISHRVDRLLLQGAPDQDILHTWLMDLHFEEYYPLFISAGYDMHTISRMTPEDLTAIGIKKPHHRKKLKAEIAQLNISDGLPDYIPSSLSEWLRLLRLEEYGSSLKDQGYLTVDDTIKIQVEDLEDIGIIKLGHQKRFLLAIKRLHDLKAGKTFPPTPFTPLAQVEDVTGTDCRCTRFPPVLKPLQSWEPDQSLYYTTDIVPIQVRGVRGKSLESLEGDLSACTLETSGMSSFMGGWPPRSGRGYYEDGDLGPEPPQLLRRQEELIVKTKFLTNLLITSCKINNFLNNIVNS